MCGSRACRKAEGKKEQRKREKERKRGNKTGGMLSMRDTRDEEISYSEGTERGCACQSLIDEDSIVVNGRHKPCSVVASTAWQHTEERNRQSSGTRRTLEREIALIGEKHFAFANFLILWNETDNA